MKIFEVAGEGKLHGLTVMSLDKFVKKEDDVEESQLDEIDRRGFLKGMGAAAVAGAAGSVMAQTESPGYWANYAAELAEKSIPRITAGAVAASLIGLEPNSGADFSKMKADIFEKVHNMVTAYCKITNSYKAKEIINKANSNAIKSSQADDPVNRGKFSVKFLIVYRSILEDALEEWKTKGTQPAQKQEQPTQQSTQQPPQEIKLNLKPNRQVGDIVTVNGGVADGKKVKVTQILGPNNGGGNRGLGVIVESNLEEFAPVGGDDREPNEEEILRQLAAQWWNGTEQQMSKAQKTLASMGWEIGQDESGDDDAGVFVIRASDINGNSYMAFNHSDLDLNEGVAEGAPELLKKEMPLHRHAEKLLAQNGVSKDDPDYHHHLNNTIKHLRQFGNIDLINKSDKQGVAESNSPVIASTADRLSNKDDGRTAKLRAAGDARREQHLKGRDIAKNDRSSKDAWGDLKEAPGDFGLGANYRAVPDDEMQDLMGRSKNKTKTKRDKFDYPYIHGSNIEVKDEAGKKFDTEKLKAAIMTRPANILGQNAKMQHSETGTEAIFDIGLPALKGLAVNEKTGEFVVVDTCPGAGACMTYCYAMKGSYVMFKAVSMGLARMLNFLLNDPQGFADKLNSEIASARSKYAKKGARIVVRWHDAGDFFSPEYMDMAYGVAKSNPDVGFYAYTKMGDVANAARPKNFNMNFSQGAKTGQEKKVNITRTKHSKVVPKDMFFDLIARKGNELIKDAKGRMQFASPENLEKFKSTLAQKYAIDKDSILTYDQMMKIPVGAEPKWNVIVMPGDGDNSANRNDVVGSYLLFH